MKAYNVKTLGKSVDVDRCTQCKGIWFDPGEAEALKDKWGAEYIDDGDAVTGKEHDKIRDINCPRCGCEMEQRSVVKQPHIKYEACKEHGLYFDAGEFTDFKYETPLDLFRDFLSFIQDR